MKIVNAYTRLAGLVLAATAITAPAQIMKCVGQDGKIEFASACPSGTQQQNTGVTNKPAAAATRADGKDAAKDKAAPKSLADRDAEFRKRQADQKQAETKAAQKATDEADRKRACESAQASLIALRSRQRMTRTDPKTGERSLYEEADFQRELPLTERLAAENCKP